MPRKKPIADIAALIRSLPPNVGSVKVNADGSFEAVLLPPTAPPAPARHLEAIPLAPGVLGSTMERQAAKKPEARPVSDIESLTRTPPAFDGEA